MSRSVILLRNLGLNRPGLGRWSTRAAVRRQSSTPLSRGGLALVVNTALTGILGFGYWILAARLFSTYAVGVAGALVAATTLFSGIGQLNLSGMLMRFLPRVGPKSRRLVVGSYVFAAGLSAFIAAASLLFVRLFVSSASPLHVGLLESFSFILAVAAYAIFTIEDSVLIGLRRTVWVPAENGTFGLAKIVALLALAPIGSAFALYGAWMIPLVVLIPAVSAMLFCRFLPLARRGVPLGRRLRSRLVRFAVGDGAGGLFTQLWTYSLPTLITASLGASVNALFYTSFLFSSTIDQVAVNYASPLTVEGARTPGELETLIRQALKHIFAIILPTVMALILIGPWLLRAFGHKYVSAAPLLDMLLIACLPKAISTVYYAYCRVQRTTHRSAMMQAYVCSATLAAVAVLARPFGLIAVGLVIVAVQSSAGIISWWALHRKPGQVERNRSDKQGRHRRAYGKGLYLRAVKPSVTER